jgi:2-polyprenyl-3-methyl-5-hydroxy-6-metoxy-1,4-benzoquinol methylase
MFDQASYWIKRHEQFRGDLRAVGNMTHDQPTQEKGVREITASARAAAGFLQPKTVLDVGCGIGRVSSAFDGCRYTGIDVSPLAIEFARRAYPAGEYIVADLAKWHTPRRFDLVVVLFVFVHFVEHDSWREAVERCLSWVAPRGSMLFADTFPQEIEYRHAHLTYWPISEYERVFSRLGFRLAQALPSDIEPNGATVQFRRAARA